jgi:aminomethyltransferase
VKSAYFWPGSLIFSLAPVALFVANIRTVDYTISKFTRKDKHCSMLNQTALYNLHLELGAKMVPFAGYLMPVQYRKGTLHEHLHCRSHAGFFDISHMGQCLILGDDTVDELGRLIPGDITELKCGELKYTLLTNEGGGIIDDIIITRIESGLRIVVNAACKEKDFNYLSSHLSEWCNFKELKDQALLALQGPAAATIMQKLSPQAAELSFMQSCESDIGGMACYISRCGYTGEDGFEISVSNECVEQLARLLLSEGDVEAIGLAARDTLRLEAGLCLYGHEISESISPVEAGLSWLFKKSCKPFPGAEKILAQLKQGPERIRAGLLVDSKIPAREGLDIYNSEGAAVGHVTSGSFSPSLNRPIAMALLDCNVANLGNTLYVKVREHRIQVTVTSLPFIPHSYYKVKL